MEKGERKRGGGYDKLFILIYSLNTVRVSAFYHGPFLHTIIGVLSEYYRSTIGVLSEYYRSISGVLSEYYRSIIGVLSEY